MSTSRSTLLIGYTFVFLAGLLISVPVAEAVFRLIGDAPSSDLRGLYVPFGHGGYRLGASVNTDASWASGRVSIYTDELGLRTDMDRRYGAKPGDAVDILLVGDSQGFGNGVNYQDSLAGSLAASAAQDGYSVRNASVGGHSLATQLMLVREILEVQRLKVSHVVILLTPVMLTTCDQENRAIVGADGRLYANEVTTGAHVRLWLKTHAVIYSRLRDAVRAYGIGVDPATRSPTHFQFYSAEAETETPERLYSCLQAFADYTSARTLNLHVVYLPSVVEADFEPVRQAAAVQGVVLDADVPFRIYSSVARRLGLQSLDLRPTLKRLRAEGHALNVKADFHYSAVLSRASGATIWKALDLPARRVARREQR